MKRFIASIVLPALIIGFVIPTVEANPRRLLNKLDNLASADRAWTAAPRASVRIENAVGPRALSRTFEQAAVKNSWKTVMPKVSNTSAIRVAGNGTVSVSTGSLTHRMAPRNGNPIVRDVPVQVDMRSSGLYSSRDNALGNRDLLKKQYAENLSPESRKILGYSIRKNEQNAATAQTMADKALANESRTQAALDLKAAKMKASGGLTTPRTYFAAKTKDQVKEILDKRVQAGRLRKKELEDKGATAYFNEGTGRSYHVHHHRDHRGGKPHVDMTRRGYKKKKSQKPDPYLLKNGH